MFQPQKKKKNGLAISNRSWLGALNTRLAFRPCSDEPGKDFSVCNPPLGAMLISVPLPPTHPLQPACPQTHPFQLHLYPIPALPLSPLRAARRCPADSLTTAGSGGRGLWLRHVDGGPASCSELEWAAALEGQSASDRLHCCYRTPVH